MTKRKGRGSLKGDDLSDGVFVAIITTNELPCDAPGECSSGAGGGGMREGMLPEFGAYPQLLHALVFSNTETEGFFLINNSDNGLSLFQT
jgi:hypothetical protein